MYTIIIHPTAPNRYDVYHDGNLICRTSRTPLLDAARTLLASGADPEATLSMRRAVGPVAMSGKVGILAGFTVRDDDRGVRFEPYRPHPDAVPIVPPPVAHQRPPALNSSEALSDPHPAA